MTSAIQKEIVNIAKQIINKYKPQKAHDAAEMIVSHVKTLLKELLE